MNLTILGKGVWKLFSSSISFPEARVTLLWKRVGFGDRALFGDLTRKQKHSLTKGRGLKYPYELLHTERRNIRLIKLFPVKLLDEIITCHLETVSLDDEPVYTTLSYVWGEAVDTRPILLNGRSHEVTVNLESALRHLSLRASEPQKFWIDALCVNQQDIFERSQQVSLMDAVYKGSSKGALQRTYALLEDLASDKHFRHIPLLWASDDSYDHSRFEICSIIEYLISKSYWNRVWIVQEFILPKHAEIVCGPFSIDRDLFIRAVLNRRRHLSSCCNSIRYPTSESLVNVRPILRDLHTRLQHLSMLFVEDANGARAKTLWQLLYYFRTSEASDPRDKIFAFLGLAEGQAGEQPLLADYGMTSHDLYANVGLRILQELQSLLILAQCTKKASHPQLPSWIPDWTASETSQAQPMEWCILFEHLFSAQGSIPASPMVPDGSLLMIQAIKVDTITATKILDVTTLPDIVALILDTFLASLSVRGSKIEKTSASRRWVHGLLPTEISDLMGQRVMRTAMGDVIISWSDLPIQKGVSLSTCQRFRDEDLNILNEFLAQVKAGVDIETIVQNPNPLYSALFTSITIKQVQGNQLLVLDQYLVGLGPQEAQEGDEIWIMASSPVPIVLRPIESNASDGVAPNRLHQLIGHCYIDGIMDGEAAENYEEKLETVRVA